MFIYIYLAIFSIIVYFFIYRFRKKIGLILNVNDLKKEKRKIHKYPTPKTASYSIAITLLCFIILNIFFFRIDKTLNLAIIGSLLFFSLGFLDDKFDLSPKIKIFFCIFIILFVTSLDNFFIFHNFYQRI